MKSKDERKINIKILTKEGVKEKLPKDTSWQYCGSYMKRKGSDDLCEHNLICTLLREYTLKDKSFYTHDHIKIVCRNQTSNLQYLKNHLKNEK